VEKQKEIGSEEKDKPVLDEQTLGKLLEAAYVLQEHNRELQEMELGLSLRREQIEAEERASPFPPRAAARPPDDESGANADYTTTLAQIVETQHQIQVRHLELENAMSLVAERLTQIARARGAAIGILDDEKFLYRAASGLLTLPAGTEVPMDKSLCVACLRTGQVFRCNDVNPEFLLDTEECRRRGIQSMIAVPIFHEGVVAGGVELYYPITHAFTEQDVHTCQLMAGLVTEALVREEEAGWKKSLATERAVMLEALEKLKPNLEALVDKSTAGKGAAKDSTATTASPAASAFPVIPPASMFVCRKCGHKIMGEEQFCGNCGMPRSSNEVPSMQSKVASIWNMQESVKKTPPADPGHSIPIAGRGENPDKAHSENALADSLEEQMPELFASTDMLANADKAVDCDTAPIRAEFEDSVLSDLEIPLGSNSQNAGRGDTQAAGSTALAKPERPTAWSSAATARDFLEQLAEADRPSTLARFWMARRGDVYLGIAVLLVACVIRWGILSNHSVGASGSQPAEAAAHHKSATDLSLFDRMLIGLGLAEAPPAPIDNGNPDAQVWVDLHTALYYCPGAELYGKTPKGKFTSQRDAQLDQFEPAYRKPCD
jgi:putative methionine-R-sulfoxide reductase with GAF domain